MLLMNLKNQFLKSINTVKKVMKKCLNKNLIMTEKQEQFQLSNSCWICQKLIDDDNEKVRDRCHISGKFRGSTYWSCNTDL